MPFYADTPARRTRQLTADAVCALLVVLAALAGRAVRSAVSAVADPARRFAEGSTSLSAQLHDAGTAVARTPLVGDDVAAVLDRSAGSAASLARAAGEQQDAVLRLAATLGLLTALVPIAVVVLVRAVQRVRWARRVRDVRALTGSAAGERVLALRALQHRPSRALLGVDADPAGAWRADDDRVVRALADLELAALGVRRAGRVTGSRT
ncbi:hypothetical protein [Kineococcus rhizosphaerae]|uniref:Uncharacterized protein n=1 Tax=Kineococcus rhizosphaerae TaxID=559628 RepID=A0A2T0QX80_9ACTN|nr:hypothetical protein [Kineococcus rhizosphaerae]PRY10460.1 hypothetical protein CLV37_11613 [Kineococcus rhizosphaerae]